MFAPGHLLPTGHRLVRRMTGAPERWLAVHPELPGRSWVFEASKRMRIATREDLHPAIVRPEVVSEAGALYPLDRGRLVAEIAAPMDPPELQRFGKALQALVERGPAVAHAETLLWDGERLGLLPAASHAADQEDLDALVARFDAGGGAPSWARAAAISSAGVARGLNEDVARVCFAEGAGLVAVVDGLGGFHGGEAAARLVSGAFVDCFLEACLADAGRPTWDTDLLLAGHAEARDLLAAIQDRGVGASALVAVVLPDGAQLLHLGKCRAYRWRAGTLKVATREHSLLNLQVDRGKLSPEEAAGNQQHRNILVRCYGGGDEEAHRPDLMRVRLRAGDRLLLCTDGLYDVVPDDTIAAVLRRAKTVRQAVSLLHGAAIEAGATDNVTVAVVEV